MIDTKWNHLCLNIWNFMRYVHILILIGVSLYVHTIPVS